MHLAQTCRYWASAWAVDPVPIHVTRALPCSISLPLSLCLAAGEAQLARSQRAAGSLAISMQARERACIRPRETGVYIGECH